MGLSWEEYWSGLSFPAPGDLTDQTLILLHWQVDSLPLSYLGSCIPHPPNIRLSLICFSHCLSTCCVPILCWMLRGGWVTEWIRHMISAPKVFAGEWGLGRGCRVKCSGQCCEAGSHGSGSATRATTGSSRRELAASLLTWTMKDRWVQHSRQRTPFEQRPRVGWTSVRQAAHP